MPAQQVDTVTDAAASPDTAQPYKELGLKPEEYGRVREILGRRPTDAERGTAGLARARWITADMAAPVRVRLKDLGLPARGSRPAGHLFVTLEPSSDVPSAAEDLLVLFTRVWTQERLAA